jgi:DNA-binding MarR family transcriptional regulator
MLDDRPHPEPIDHIGWQLWQAAQDWLAQFESRMIGAGYPWFGEARAGVLLHLTAYGTPQSHLVSRMRISKQAVQQLVDQLVADGIVERRPDPADKRGKLLFFTPKGRKLLDDANRIKLEIEGEYRERLGAAHLTELEKLLTALHPASTAPIGKENAIKFH